MSKISDTLIVSLYVALASFTLGLGMSWLALSPIEADGLTILAACFGLLSILMASHLDLANPSARRFDGWL